MSNASLYDMINATVELPVAKVAKHWSKTLGEVNNRGGFSNCDDRSYFEAITADGERVRCRYTLNNSATIVHADHHKSSEYELGSSELPNNWVEIYLNSYSYSNKNSHPEGILVARNNQDGTAQTFKTRY